MSKENSTILKGIAILMMLFYHLFNRTEINELCTPLIMIGDTPLIHYLSQACYPVPFFLILSGYGLTYLYRNNRLGIRLEIPRLLKLYIHYWIVLLIFMPIAYCLYPMMYKYDILHIIGNITAIRCNYNGEVWFLFPYALICLTAYPIINYLYQLNGKIKIFFTIIVYAILFMIVKYMSFCLSDNLVINIVQQQLIYYVILLFYFALGILLYRLLEKKMLFIFHNQNICIMLIMCLIIIKSLFKITIADGLYALLFIILFLNISLNKYVAKMLQMVGHYSMPMWMTHTFFCAYLFPDFIYGFKYPLFIFFVLVLISYLTAIPIMSISKMTINIFMKSLIIFVVSFSITTSAMADDFDNNNYRPENSSVKVEESNLPLVFIDTRHGSESPNVIHKDYAIVARMKVIMNDNGINYGDTLAHPNQKVNYEGWISIRYRGNTSFSASEKKPFNIRTLATDNVDGKKEKVEMMGMPKDNKWTMLAPYNDRSMIRDVMLFQLVRPYFDYVPRARHCEVILDGIYYGIYIMIEKPSKGKHRLNLDDPGTSGDELTGGYQLEVDRDDEPNYFRSNHIMKNQYGYPYTYNNTIVFQYKHPDYDEMTTEQIEYIQNQVDRMEKALESDDFTDPEKGYRHYLDAISFIDQQLSQEVSGNIDGYRLSTNIYKQRDSQNPLFRTTLWDFNLAFGNAMQMGGTKTDHWVYKNTYVPSYDYKVPFWWSRMMEDPTYVVQLKARWKQYREGFFSNTHIENTIDSLVSHLQVKNALQRNNTAFTMFGGKYVWPVPNVDVVNTYDKEIAYLKNWLKTRIAWLDTQLEYTPQNTGINDYFNSVSIQPIEGYYNLQGIKMVKPAKGITIVKYNNKREKYVVK